MPDVRRTLPPVATFDLTEGIRVGDRVRRTKGQPQNVGREGIVTFVSDPNVVGSAGDVLVSVREDDGTAFQCYVRQVRKVPA